MFTHVYTNSAVKEIYHIHLCTLKKWHQLDENTKGTGCIMCLFSEPKSFWKRVYTTCIYSLFIYWYLLYLFICLFIYLFIYLFIFNTRIAQSGIVSFSRIMLQCTTDWYLYLSVFWIDTSSEWSYRPFSADYVRIFF